MRPVKSRGGNPTVKPDKHDKYQFRHSRPEGDLLHDTAMHLKERGYIIQEIDLINMERSHFYNPFV